MEEAQPGLSGSGKAGGGTGRVMTGGEEITQGMIWAKKAQLARVKNDELAAQQEKQARKARKARKAEGARDQATKGKGAKGKDAKSKGAKGSDARKKKSKKSG